MELEDARIMLVEDNPEDVAFTRRVLRQSSLDRDLVLAMDGKEALGALEGMAGEGDLPDLILLDINLPDISGIDLLTKIREDERYRGLPVVMLTGSNIDDDIQRSYDLGAKTYLVKPISKDALMHVIRSLSP